MIQSKIKKPKLVNNLVEFGSGKPVHIQDDDIISKHILLLESMKARMFQAFVRVKLLKILLK